MGTVDSVEEGVTGGVLPWTSENSERLEEKMKHPVSLPTINDGKGLIRLKEEEDLKRVLSPNIRLTKSFISIDKKMERLETLIENHLSPYRKDQAYLACVKKVAPLHPTLAETLLDKIEDTSVKLKGYLYLAKYGLNDTGEQVLKKAVSLFSYYTYSSNKMFSIIDSLFSNSDPLIQSFYWELHSKIAKERFNWMPPDFLLLNLEIRMNHPNKDETLLNLHKDIIKKHSDTTSLYPSYELIKLLDYEGKMESPLAFETLSYLRTFIDSGNMRSWNLRDFLITEAKYPFLSTEFKKDLKTIMKDGQEVIGSDYNLKSLAARIEDDYDLKSLVTGIAPYHVDIAEKLLEKINDEDEHLMAWLEIVREKQKLGKLDKEEAFNTFNQKLLVVKGLDADDFVDLFLKSAKVFGVDKTAFLIDRAVKSARPSIEEALELELRDAKAELSHTFKKGLGLESSLPKNKEEKVSKFSHISLRDLNSILRGLKICPPPMREEAIEKFYEKVGSSQDGEMLYAIKGLIEAEFSQLGSFETSSL